MDVLISIECATEIRSMGSKKALKRANTLNLALKKGEAVLSLGADGAELVIPIGALIRAHTKFVSDGKLTVEVTHARAPHSVFVDSAPPAALRKLLETVQEIKEAVSAAKKRGNKLSESGLLELLSKRFPKETKRALKKQREAAPRAGPQPLKGHTQLMFLVDGRGTMIPSEAGKALCLIAEGMGLSLGSRSSGAGSQAFSIVAKRKGVQMLAMSVRSCSHHKFKSALWIEVDAAEGIDCAALRTAVETELAEGSSGRCAVMQIAHGAVKERLAQGVSVRLISGKPSHGEGGGSAAQRSASFSTLLELLADDGSLVLGKCELRYFEPEALLAAPLCVELQMNEKASLTQFCAPVTPHL
jgi:hypothetical protein